MAKKGVKSPETQVADAGFSVAPCKIFYPCTAPSDIAAPGVVHDIVGGRDITSAVVISFTAATGLLVGAISATVVDDLPDIDENADILYVAGAAAAASSLNYGNVTDNYGFEIKASGSKVGGVATPTENTVYRPDVGDINAFSYRVSTGIITCYHIDAGAESSTIVSATIDASGMPLGSPGSNDVMLNNASSDWNVMGAGTALFTFENGTMPADAEVEEKIKWMFDQWIGQVNRILPPGWGDVRPEPETVVAT